MFQGLFGLGQDICYQNKKYLNKCQAANIENYVYMQNRNYEPFVVVFVF